MGGTAGRHPRGEGSPLLYVGRGAGARAPGLLESESLTLRAVTAPVFNGVYIHDRRGGSRQEVASVQSASHPRHASDEYYGVALGTELDADLILLTGTEPEGILDGDVYRRFTRDLRANGKLVIADLARAALIGALAGGVELLKISHEELLAGGYASGTALADLIAGARELHRAGARHVLVSRAADTAL